MDKVLSATKNDAMHRKLRKACRDAEGCAAQSGIIAAYGKGEPYTDKVAKEGTWDPKLEPQEVQIGDTSTLPRAPS